VRSGSAQAEAAYLFVPGWLRMVSLHRPLFEEYDVIRPSGPIGKRWASRQYLSQPNRSLSREFTLKCVSRTDSSATIRLPRAKRTNW
jgi:hypothetical protein